MNSKLGQSIAILAVLLFAVFGIRELLSLLFPSLTGYGYGVTRGALQCLTCVAATAALLRAGPNDALRELRVVAPWAGPMLMAVVATLPFPATYLAFGANASEVDVAHLGYGAVVAPLVEEIVFRGFGFWMLHRLAGWSFWPAAILPAILFASRHLYQAEGAWEAVGIMLLVGSGAVWFSWLLLRWDSLWAPIGMHALMNGWWDLFDIDTTALGGGTANAVRAASIAASIVITRRCRPASPTQSPET